MYEADTVSTEGSICSKLMVSFLSGMNSMISSQIDDLLLYALAVIVEQYVATSRLYRSFCFCVSARKKKKKDFTSFCQPTQPIACANHGNHVQFIMKSRQSTT